MEYQTAGDAAAAWQVFEPLIADHPDYIASYAPAGEALLMLGRRDDARLVYARGLEAADRRNEAHARDHLETLVAALDADK